MSSANDRAERAKRRATWSIQRFDLATPPNDDLSLVTTVEERMNMMWGLALDAWSWRGEPLPTYERANMPGRVLRGTDGRADSE